MSIVPITFNADGSIDAISTELGHTGTIAAAEIAWATNPDGSENHNFIVLNCPDGCGASSIHPVGGGAAPPEVQQMFVNKTVRGRCPCGAIALRDQSAAPAAHVRLNCNRLDGPGRWQVPAAAGRAAVHETAADTFEIVYRTSDRLVIGMLPDGSVAADQTVDTLTLDQYDVLMRTDPAYLSADGTQIVDSPPA